MDDEIIERKLNISKSGKTCMWVQTNRFTSPANRYGFSSAVCSADGKLTNIIYSTNNYTRIRNLVEIAEGCILITASISLNETNVKLFQVISIDKENMTINLKKLATLKDSVWDNTEYVKKYKAAIHSALMRAKKYYNLIDVD